MTLIIDKDLKHVYLVSVVTAKESEIDGGSVHVEIEQRIVVTSRGEDDVYLDAARGRLTNTNVDCVAKVTELSRLQIKQIVTAIDTQY